MHGSHSVQLSPTLIWREMSPWRCTPDFARCCHVLAPALDGIDIEVADALNKLCDPQATIDRADATALASALLLELRRSYQAKGGRLGTWARSPRY